MTALGSARAVVWPLADRRRGVLALAPPLGRVLGPASAGDGDHPIGVDVLKDVVDRPRPAGGLVAAPGSSYPSGHAAHSVFYAWLALTSSLRLRPGMARGDGAGRRRARAHRR